METQPDPSLQQYSWGLLGQFIELSVPNYKLMRRSNKAPLHKKRALKNAGAENSCWAFHQLCPCIQLLCSSFCFRKTLPQLIFSCAEFSKYTFVELRKGCERNLKLEASCQKNISHSHLISAFPLFSLYYMTGNAPWDERKIKLEMAPFDFCAFSHQSPPASFVVNI